MGRNPVGKTSWIHSQAKEKYYSEKRLWFKKFRQQLRKETMKAYGGECVCCGESHWEFLTLDHPDGNGQQDRALYRMQTGQLYGHLRKNGWPRKDYYRVLCMNCNWIRRFGGVCPHQKEGLTP